ncbi:MAG: hypothetical protein AAGF11_08370 [Myxococcota bacterium]
MASPFPHILGRSLLAVGLLTTACSDDGLAGASGSASAGSTRGSTTAPDMANESMGDPEQGPMTSSGPDSGPPGADTSGTGMSDGTGGTGMSEGTGAPATGSDTGSTGTGTGSTGESTDTGTSTGGQGNVVYSATAIPGGLDRIRINKADLDNDRCTWVVLVAPALPGSYPGLATPAGWSVESVFINDVAAACNSDNPAMFGSEPALDANGTITFGMLGGGGIYPCMVDIDALLDFQGVLPMIPPMDDMIAVDIPVMGC